MLIWPECAVIGQKVTPLFRANEWVCMSAGNPVPGELMPEFGEVYTIRTIEAKDSGVFFRFFEIVNSMRNYGGHGVTECQFCGTCFRPVEPSKINFRLVEELMDRCNNYAKTKEPVEVHR